MDLSDGDEDCDDSEAQEANLLHIKMNHTKTSCTTQEDSTTENFRKTTTYIPSFNGMTKMPFYFISKSY